MTMECRKPLPVKDLEFPEWYKPKPERVELIKRVVFYDPSEVYARLGDKLDPYKRHPGLSVEQCFPKIEGKCACGCDKVPAIRPGADRKKWASDDCYSFASNVISIINNYFQKPQWFTTLYYGKKCIQCESTNALELDHIIGVKQGGGGCWLSNYRWLCRTCHVDKTNQTFKKKQYKETTQIKIEL